jgi:hypothetical protein
MINPKPPEKLSVKDWISVVSTNRLSTMVIFLLCSYGFLIVSTTAIFFLEGFHFKCFNLDPSLIKWLGGATIGEIGGLLTLTFKESFKA